MNQQKALLMVLLMEQHTFLFNILSICVCWRGGGDSKGKRGFMVTGEKNLPLISQKVICSINYGCFIHIYIHGLLYAVT